MVGSKFDYIERTKTDGYDRNDWKKRKTEAVRQATEGGAPALIRHQQREQLDQATGGKILDGKPDTTGIKNKKLLRAMRRKQGKQMRQAIEDTIPGDTPEEDTDGQQEAGQ